MSEDRTAPIENGMNLGYGYAERRRNDRLSLGRIAKARSASEVTANVDPAEIAADGIADSAAFWSGFAHGVSLYLLDEGHARLDQQPGAPVLGNTSHS
jgi:hypothetical protein